GGEPQGDALAREAAACQRVPRGGAQENLERNGDPRDDEGVDREAPHPAAGSQSVVVLEGEAPGPPIGRSDRKRAPRAERDAGHVDQGRDREERDRRKSPPGAGHGGEASVGGLTEWAPRRWTARGPFAGGAGSLPRGGAGYRRSRKRNPSRSDGRRARSG